MSEMLSHMSGGELIGFFSVAGAMFISASAIIGGLWASVRLAEFRARRTELEVGLKQDMLNRGMSVDEIERVLAAGQTNTPPCSADQVPLPKPTERKSRGC